MNTVAKDAQRSNADMAMQERELAELIVSALNLDVAASDIDPEAPLFHDGLGLDSIDVLEVALAVSKAYGIKLRADDTQTQHVFGSLRSLNQYIRQQRAG